MSRSDSAEDKFDNRRVVKQATLAPAQKQQNANFTQQDSSFSDDKMDSSHSDRSRGGQLQKQKTLTGTLAARPQNNFPTANSALAKSQLSRPDSNLKEGGSFDISFDSQE
jgi:hypothetical protein